VPTRLALRLVESIARQLRVFRSRSASRSDNLNSPATTHDHVPSNGVAKMGCHRHGDFKLVAAPQASGVGSKGIIHADSTPTPALQGPPRGAGVHSLGLLMLPMTLDMPDEGTPSR
jgi:hypothetical protein